MIYRCSRCGSFAIETGEARVERFEFRMRCTGPGPKHDLIVIVEPKVTALLPVDRTPKSLR